jgi:hypothetical protein
VTNGVKRYNSKHEKLKVRRKVCNEEDESFHCSRGIVDTSDVLLSKQKVTPTIPTRTRCMLRSKPLQQTQQRLLLTILTTERGQTNNTITLGTFRLIT